MLVKLNENGHLEYFPGWIQHEDKIYTNNEAEQIAPNHGYKRLVTDETPTYNEQTQYLDIMYIEEEKCIRQIWDIKSFESLENTDTIESEV